MNSYWVDDQTLEGRHETFADSAPVVIVFKSKLSALMKFIRDHQILGNISAFERRIKYQRQGIPHAHILFWSDFDIRDIPAVDTVITVRCPRDSPFLEHKEMVRDFPKLIHLYQIHQHSKRCRFPDGKRRFGYPQQSLDVTTSINTNLTLFAMLKKPRSSFIILCCWHTFDVTTASRSFTQTNALDMF
jgi:hypothetical protein